MDTAAAGVQSFRKRNGKIVNSRSLKKTGLDMLGGPIWSRILLFSLPAAATGLLEQLFDASDIAIVGSFTHAARTEGIAAVGANAPITGLIVNFFIGIAIGVNVVIARQIGQRKTERIGRTIQTSVLMTICAGILIAIIGELSIT